MKKILCIVGNIEYELFYSLKLQSEAYIITGYILTKPSYHFKYIKARDNIQDFDVMFSTYPMASLSIQYAIFDAINENEDMPVADKRIAIKCLI